MVILLNLGVSPPEVHHTYIIEMFSSEKECVKRHNEFFSKLKQEGQPVPDNFNLGCVPLKVTMV